MARIKVYSLDRIRSEQDPWKRFTVIMLSTSILRSISANGIGIPMPFMYIVAMVRLCDWARNTDKGKQYA